MRKVTFRRKRIQTLVIPALAVATVVIIAAMVFGWYDSAPEVYRDSDRALMWETERRSSDGQHVSTHDAQAAAARVFENVRLTGLTHAEVIELLGDPKRSNNSMYNFPVIFGSDRKVSNVEALGIE